MRGKGRRCGVLVIVLCVLVAALGPTVCAESPDQMRRAARYEAAIEALVQEAERLEEAGSEEEAAELRMRAEELEERLRDLERPGGDVVTIATTAPEARERLERLRRAAEWLEQEGLYDAADAAYERAEAIQRDWAESRIIAVVGLGTRGRSGRGIIGELRERAEQLAEMGREDAAERLMEAAGVLEEMPTRGMRDAIPGIDVFAGPPYSEDRGRRHEQMGDTIERLHAAVRELAARIDGLQRQLDEIRKVLNRTEER